MFHKRVIITKSDAGSAAQLQNFTSENTKKVPDKVSAPRLYFRIPISHLLDSFSEVISIKALWLPLELQNPRIVSISF